MIRLAERRCTKPWPIEAQRTQLLTCIKENAAPPRTTVSRPGASWSNVRQTQPRRKVVPCGLPERRALRRKRQGVGSAP